MKRLPAVRRYQADRRCLPAGCSPAVALFQSRLPSRNRCLPAGRPIHFQATLMRLEMLGLAVNCQPGFRRGTRRAKQRSEEHFQLQTGRCCNLAADLPGQLTGNIATCCLPTQLQASLAGCSIPVCLSVSLAGLACWLEDDAD